MAEEGKMTELIHLNATGLKLGLLANFGQYLKLEYERIALSPNQPIRVD